MLHREGDLEVLPTGFDREHGKLSGEQIGERSNLTKELNKRSAQGRGFPASIEFAGARADRGVGESGTAGGEGFCR